MSDTTRKHLDLFWELVDEILNALLFALIGLEPNDRPWKVEAFDRAIAVAHQQFWRQQLNEHSFGTRRVLGDGVSDDADRHHDEKHSQQAQRQCRDQSGLPKDEQQLSSIDAVGEQWEVGHAEGGKCANVAPSDG